MVKLEYENEMLKNGYKLIAGVDEAGRGPLAGPVVVASCIMPLDTDKIIDGIDDSKKITEKNRGELYEKIVKTAISYSVSILDEKTIDKINILNATKLGMKNVIESLNPKPDIVLVDAVKGIDTTIKTYPIIHGDALSYNIGAASIIAKVTRDRLMIELDKKYPNYNFKKHKGYGTKEHIENLKKFGKCEIHRASFIKKIV